MWNWSLDPSIQSILSMDLNGNIHAFILSVGLRLVLEFLKKCYFLLQYWSFSCFPMTITVVTCYPVWITLSVCACDLFYIFTLCIWCMALKSTHFLWRFSWMCRSHIEEQVTSWQEELSCLACAPFSGFKCSIHLSWQWLREGFVCKEGMSLACV